ncbi:MAG TPA: hypothetical protein VD993_20540 [Chitinophagaceae bacterium]|nr:hypothetical protein [Chitinophagaceae bacterium]
MDSVTKPASTRYSNMNFLKRIFLGSNYRKEWATPVKMPVLDIKTIHGGLTPTELGGGQQTKNLRLKDKNGKEWALRSVDKEVEKAIQPHLRKTFVKKLVQDMVSASHPYAALTIPELATAAHVVAPRPTLYYVPDDPALGEFRKIFANTVCMLEEREPTPDGSETEDTDELLEELMEESDHVVMQEQVLRARLLDMLVADWDRHIDQWKWGKYDSAGKTRYYVIPRDRDFAYFNSAGVIVTVMSWISLPHMRGFTEESKGLKKLNAKSWFFDHNFLNELDADDWKRIIADFQQSLSDDVISRAIKKIPPEVYAISGREIEEKLRSRRDGLMENAMKYYDYLANTVHVMGTDHADFFRVSQSGDDITVSVQTYDKKQPGKVMYNRVFKRKETNEIFLNGFGDDDHFEVDDNVSTKIRFIVEGGAGKDNFVERGKVRAKMMEVESTEDDDRKLSKANGKKNRTGF